MVAEGLNVTCIVENIYIVFGTTCLSVTATKLLLLSVIQLPSLIFDIKWHRLILLEIRNILYVVVNPYAIVGATSVYVKSATLILFPVMWPPS